MIRVNVSSFMNRPEGSREAFKLDKVVHFDGPKDPELTAPITGHVKMLKLPHEINVQITHIETEAKCVCSRCNKHFRCKITVPFAEREFIIDLPKRLIVEGEDVKYVDKRTNEIELFDMLREEILLHSPEIPVCSKSCKGLCYQCGINLNEKTCECRHALEVKPSPFKFRSS